MSSEKHRLKRFLDAPFGDERRTVSIERRPTYDLIPSQSELPAEPAPRFGTAPLPTPRDSTVHRAFESIEHSMPPLRRTTSLIAMGVIVGACISLFATVILKKESPVAIQHAVPSVIEVSVVDPALPRPAAATLESSVSNAAAITNANPISQVQTSAIAIAPRKFLYMGGSQRSYAPGYEMQNRAPIGDVPQSFVLKPLSDSNGRYVSSSNELQWQGNWSANDPSRNIELGGAYQEYLKQRVGDGFSNSLSVFDRADSNLVEGLKAVPQLPSSGR